MRGSAAETIAVLMSNALVSRLFDAEAQNAIGYIAQTGASAGEKQAPSLSTMKPGVDILVTGWDSPAITDAALDEFGSLKLIAHTGGSIRRIVPRSVFERGIRVTTVAGVLAEGVAEFTVMMILAGLRRAFEFERSMRAGTSWRSLEAEPPGRLLSAQTVGLVGASRVGRAVIPLLRAFGAHVVVADPFLSDGEAHTLGVERVSLAELLERSDVVSLHAPTLPSTTRMIGAAELGLMRDGALLVNTARAALIDPAPLEVELRSGRIAAALDVFDEEPLPVDSVWRSLPNCVATPHVAALTDETLKKQGAEVVAEINRFRTSGQLRGEITAETFDRIA